MADQIMIGAGIKLDGEADFVKAVASISKNQTVLASEMRKVTAEFADNATSEKALSALSEEYNKKIEVQKNKVNLLQAALENARKEYGDNSDKVKDWQIKLNNAETQLAQSESALKGLNTQLDKSNTALEDAGESAEKSGSKFKVFGGVVAGVGAAMGAVAVAAAAAAVKMGQEVVEQFSALEQNLGGSEAVFGEYAASIQKTGEEAYKNLGISQSEYLATANKMGALFQGSGIAQQESLDLTTKAMQRAADMASVMGIDMSTAMEAVSGAAKGNFTMMDNLGVSMNATSIQAYAVSKGLDFVWASASNAEKSQLAMQMFFEQTEQYAGNFAKEATETISGSIGMLEAALSSFTAGLGNANADMANLTQNLVDAFQAVVKNIVPVLENIVTALPPVADAIIQAIGDLLPELLETVTSIFTQMLNTILSLLPKLIPTAVDAILTIVDALIDNLPLLVDAALTLVTSLADGITKALPTLIPAAVQAVTTIAQGLVDKLPVILQAGLDLFMGLVESLYKAIPQIIAALPDLITGIVKFLINAIPQITDTGIELLSAILADIPSIVDAWAEAIPELIDNLVGLITSDENKSKMGDAGSDLLVSLFTNIPKIIEAFATFLPKAIKGIIERMTGMSFEEMFGETGAAVADFVVGYSSGFNVGGLFDGDAALKKSNTSNSVKSTDSPAKETETQAEIAELRRQYKSLVAAEDYDAAKLVLNAIMEKENAQSKMTDGDDLAKDKSVSTLGSSLTGALTETTDAVKSLNNTISDAATAAGITAADSVGTATDKILAQMYEQQKIAEVTAAATKLAADIASGNVEIPNGNGGYSINTETGKVSYLIIGERPAEKTASESIVQTAAAAGKTTNPVNNYNITVDVSKVKNLNDILRIADEAKQQQRAGYVE